MNGKNARELVQIKIIAKYPELASFVDQVAEFPAELDEKYIPALVEHEANHLKVWLRGKQCRT